MSETETAPAEDKSAAPAEDKPAAQAAEIPVPDNQVKDPVAFVTLRKPIQAYGKEIRTIGFREPQARDTIRNGNPVNLSPYGDRNINDVTFDEGKMNKMLGALANIPAASLEDMNSNDWIDCAWAVAPFFIAGIRRA